MVKNDDQGNVRLVKRGSNNPDVGGRRLHAVLDRAAPALAICGDGRVAPRCLWRGLFGGRGRRRASRKGHTDISVTLFDIEGLNVHPLVNNRQCGIVWNLRKQEAYSFAPEKIQIMASAIVRAPENF